MRLSNQNQLFLNTWRPTRCPISAGLLESAVPGFKAGAPCMLRVTYLEKNVNTYHRYVGGDVWVPTCPTGTGKPDDIFHVEMQLFGLDDFFARFPDLMLTRDSPQVGSENAIVRVKRSGADIHLKVEQLPPIEDIWDLSIVGSLKGNLIFQTGTILARFETSDAFGVKRGIRLYHNGHDRAGLAVEAGRDVFPVTYLSYDGFRLRLTYSYSKGRSVTSVYLKKPDALYRIGEMSEIPNELHFNGITRMFKIDSILPLRELERSVAFSRNYYEIGRIGAEIAYGVICQKFGYDDLVIAEPAKGGKDIYGKDSGCIVQARLVSHTPPKWFKSAIGDELRQMTHKLQVDFRYTPDAKVGYAVLSYVEFGMIKSLIAQVQSIHTKRG